MRDDPSKFLSWGPQIRGHFYWALMGALSLGYNKAGVSLVPSASDAAIRVTY